MTQSEIETRERIISCTLALVSTESDFSSITVRRIASAAGVNVSAVNYHFGSKEKLINEVIRRPIVEFLTKHAGAAEQYNHDPIKKLKELVKLPARYLAHNPNISRVSILSDMTSPIEYDLTEQTQAYLMPAMRAAFPDMDEKAAFLEVWRLVSLIQTSFLRSASFLKLTGINYFNDAGRDAFLEKQIDALAEKHGGVSNV